MAFLTLELVVGSIVFSFLLEAYLALRQIYALKSSKLPVALEGVINTDKYMTSNQCMIEKRCFHLVHETATTAADCTILLCGMLPWLWKISGCFLEFVGLDLDNEILHSLAFLGTNLLCDQCKNTDEIAAIIAHEMGHWKLNHTTYAFVASQVLTLVLFGLFDFVRNSSNLFLSFGFDKQPIIVGLIIFQHVMMPVQRITSFGMNILSRSSEFKADVFAKNMGYGVALRSNLVKLQEKNLAAVTVDPWYSVYYYPHPPFGERLAVLDELDKKSA